MAALAVEQMKAPEYFKPTRPVLPKKGENKDDEWEIVKTDYICNIEEWKEDFKEFKSLSSAWEENKARVYNLILQHCPKDLEIKLKGLADWDTVSSGQDAIQLLTMVRALTHKHDKMQQGTMAYVESDNEL